MATNTNSIVSPIASMVTVRSDFETRMLEVDNYFDFVVALAEGRVSLMLPTTQPFTEPDSSETFIKTLKANCYLLLYNVVESTVKNAIQAIFDEMDCRQVSFDHCRAEVKQIVVRNLKRHNPDKICIKLVSIAQHVIVETFDKNEIASGNLDAAKIRTIAKEYGFPSPSSTVPTNANLLKIKTTRNDLAHGDKSFGDVGRDAIPTELSAAKEQVRKYLESMLNNIEQYLRNSEYLSASSVGSPVAVVSPSPVHTGSI